MKRIKKLKVDNKKSNELDKNTTDIKETLNNLRKAPIVKNTHTISESDRNKIKILTEKNEALSLKVNTL